MDELKAYPSPFLLTREAAAFLRLSPRTLERQRRLGIGPPYTKYGRRVVYELGDLKSYAFNDPLSEQLGAPAPLNANSGSDSATGLRGE